MLCTCTNMASRNAPACSGPTCTHAHSWPWAPLTTRLATCPPSGPSRDLHSGNEGGVFCEPLSDLSKVLASLVDSRSNIQVCAASVAQPPSSLAGWTQPGRLENHPR